LLKELKNWVESFLEKPFYDIELNRVEVLKQASEDTGASSGLPKQSQLKLKEVHR